MAHATGPAGDPKAPADAPAIGRAELLHEIECCLRRSWRWRLGGRIGLAQQIGLTLGLLTASAGDPKRRLVITDDGRAALTDSRLANPVPSSIGFIPCAGAGPMTDQTRAGQSSFVR
jgi:hypothetical protein